MIERKQGDDRIVRPDGAMTGRPGHGAAARGAVAAISSRSDAAATGPCRSLARGGDHRFATAKMPAQEIQ